MKTQIAGDLLAGSVAPLILRIAMPSMAAMLASSLCTLADALLLSRGSTPLSAAVSVSFSLLTLIQTLGFTLGMGAGSFVSRSLGRGDKPSAYAVASTAFFAALALSVLLCAPGALLAAPLVCLLGSPEDIVPSAAAYARYVLASGPLLCASLVLSSLLRAQGKTAPNMLAFVAGAAVGIPLEFLLVRGLNLGVHGGGVSMLASESVTLAILIAAALRDKHLVRPRLRGIALRLRVWRDIMRSGLPTLLRQGLMSVSSILLTRVSASFGASALAGMGLCVRAAALVASAVIGFGQGFQPVCGFCFGAGKYSRVRKAFWFCVKVSTVILLVLGCSALLCAEPIVTLFRRDDPEVIRIGTLALQLQLCTLPLWGYITMSNMFTQSIGYGVRATLISTARQGLFLIPALLVLPPALGLLGIQAAQPVADALSFLFSLAVVSGILRQLRKTPDKEAPAGA